MQIIDVSDAVWRWAKILNPINNRCSYLAVTENFELNRKSNEW